MANLDGAALYSMISKLFAIHPPGGRLLPPMLLLSGFASQPRARELLRSPGVRGLVSKPFNIEYLVDQVAAALV
jgi:response regulator RpfG family c-di-GMP phosphodiesterase